MAEAEHGIDPARALWRSLISRDVHEMAVRYEPRVFFGDVLTVRVPRVAKFARRTERQPAAWLRFRAFAEPGRCERTGWRREGERRKSHRAVERHGWWGQEK